MVKKQSYLLTVLFLLTLCLNSCDKDEPVPDNTGDEIYSSYITGIVMENSNLWIGTLNSGLYKLNANSWTSYTSTDGIVNDTIRALAVDNDGNLWIGTKGGISKFDGTIWTHNINYLNAFVEPILYTSTGDVWVGHYTGAYLFSIDTWTKYTVSNGLISNHVMSFTVDCYDNVWTGTDSGLCMFDGSSWTHYTTEDGLSGNDITAIECDQNGDIWVGSSEGLSKLSN